MKNINVSGSSDELKQVIEFCKSKKISFSIINQESNVDLTMLKPIYIDMNDVQNSKRINSFFLNNEKSKPVYSALVEK